MFVDGSSLIFRAFYGVPTTFRSPDGKPINGVRGFMDRLAALVTEYRPGRLAVASDEDWRPAWRVELIPSYKSHLNRANTISVLILKIFTYLSHLSGDCTWDHPFGDGLIQIAIDAGRITAENGLMRLVKLIALTI